MTRKEMFEALVTLATANNRNDLVEFCKKELEVLNRAKVRKQEERDALTIQVVEVLTNATEPMRTKDIANEVGISPQKATAILKGLLNDKRVVAMEEKKVKLFSIA